VISVPELSNAAKAPNMRLTAGKWCPTARCRPHWWPRHRSAPDRRTLCPTTNPSR